MTAAWHFERHSRFFSAFNRRRAAARLFRGVRFRPGFEAVECRTLLSAVIVPANAPEPAFVGDFDGQSDLLTVNAGSNELTLTTGYDGPNPVTSTISSGGVDPSVAFAFKTQTGYDNLVVGNTGDGVLAFFQGTSKGLTLQYTMSVPGLRDATGLVVSKVSSHELQFFVLVKSPVPGLTATEGPFAVVLPNSVPGAPLLLAPSGINAASGQFAPSAQGSNGVAQLVPLQESSLALVGTLLPLSVEASSSALPGGVETQALAAAVSPAGGQLTLGQSLLGGGDRFTLASAGNEGQPLVPGDQPARLGNPSAPGWQSYTLGTGDALERFDREHPDLFQRSSDDASGTNSGTGQNEGETARSADTVDFESSTVTASPVAVEDVAGQVVDFLCGDDSLGESARWWRDDASEPRVAGDRSELSASLALTSVVAGCLYFGAAGERGRANGRRSGARRRYWI